MAFPQTWLDVLIELFLNGMWTDVTADVYTAEKIIISRGRADEGTRTDPGKCTLTFNNRNGTYSPRNPNSPYYGQLGRNTPIRVSVPGPDSYLELDGDPANYAATPDTAALDITGDIDIRWEGEADWYAPGAQMLIGKWGAAGQRSYNMYLQDGEIVIHVAIDGSIGPFLSLAVPALPRHAALRGTIVADNGRGGCTLSLYWAPTLDGPWTQIFQDVDFSDVGPITIWSGTAPLSIAPTQLDSTPPRRPLAGRCYRAEVRDGIDGTVVAAPDFTTLDAGTTTFTDSAGLDWTLSGTARVSDRRIRFIGEVSSWPSKWDISGNDVRVPVEAAGILRRLGQGRKALQSALRRRIPSGNPLAYWPMEDGSAATQAASALDGGRPLTVTGLTFASDTSLPSSAALPVLGESSTLIGTVPGATVGGWHVEMVYKLDKLPATEQTMFSVRLGASDFVMARVRVSTAGVRVQVLDGEGSVGHQFVVSDADALAAFTGVWNRLRMYTSVSGSTTFVTASWQDVVTDIYWYCSLSYTGTPGRVVGVQGSWGSDFQGMGIGHLAAFDVGGTSATSPGVTIFANADEGFAGETAWTRMRRLATEEDLPLARIPGPLATERVGPQTVDTLLDLLQAASDVDGGLLLEDSQRSGLVYRERSSLYNQTPALILAYDQAPGLAGPLEPVDDDQKVANDRTVTRVGGSSARAVLTDGPLSVQDPPDGVGVYDDELTLSLYSDDQALPIAGWRLHLGTVDEARYPVVNIDLAAAPDLADTVTAMDSGDRLQIVGPPPWLPPGPIDLIMEGYQETIGHPNDWNLQLNCTPASPWQVGMVVDESDPGATGVTLFRVDTGGSELATDATATDTTLPVGVTDGPVWGQAAAPLTDDSGWTAGGGTWSWDGPLRAGRDTIDLVTDGATTGPRMRSGAGPVTAGSVYRATAWVQSTSGVAYGVYVRWLDASGTTISNTTATTTTATGTWTLVDTGSLTAPAGATQAQVMVGWPSTSFPSGGTHLYVDTARLRPFVAADSPAEFPFDIVCGGERMTVTAISGTASPQTFTVTRSVNSVVKAQTAGTAVSLADPAIVAL